jgi:hypothetical protein
MRAASLGGKERGKVEREPARWASRAQAERFALQPDVKPAERALPVR